MNFDLNALYRSVMAQTEVYDTISGVCNFYEYAKNSTADPEDWRALETWPWAQLLAYAPVDDEMMALFDFNRLESEDWAFLLSENVEMIHHPAFAPEKMNAKNWLDVLFFYPVHIEFCPDHILMDAVRSGTITPEMFGKEIEWDPIHTFIIGCAPGEFGNWLLDNKVRLTDQDFKREEKYNSPIPRAVWLSLVAKRPEFLRNRRCPYYEFTREDWKTIKENCKSDFRQYLPQDLFTQNIFPGPDQA